MTTDADHRISACIDGSKSFLVDAGAGSGKTYSLVRALNYIRGEQRDSLVQKSQQVACVTFTNVAKDEIAERTEHDPLVHVSTIHDFLWTVIKGFQNELRTALLAHNANLPANSKRKVPQQELEAAVKSVPITYSDRGAKFLEGRIFHDDLLDIALVMFKTRPLLSKITAARYPFIFVDEYQDTSGKVISILMDHVYKAGAAVIGFFGDKMQSIYSDGIGELPQATLASLEIIPKEQNYRCSKAVIDVLNKIRTDIQQFPAGDNLPGAAVYINLASLPNGDDPLAKAREIAREKFGLSSADADTKILFLTHRLIAAKAGYGTLWKAYNDRGGFYQERFQSGEDEVAAFFLKKLEPLIRAWKDGKTGRAISIIKEGGGVIADSAAREASKSALNKLIDLSGSATITGVLLHVEGSKLLQLPDGMTIGLHAEPQAAEAEEGPDREKKFFQEIWRIPYREVTAYREVFESNLPYSTKHGVKGAEFKTVFVILDDAGAKWTQYSFGKLLAGTEANEARRVRTRNLFYVCCSRSKDKLVVVDLGNSDDSHGVKAMFGEENCSFE